ncbi:TPA: hypothetical protein ACKRXW_003053 [Proteus mirabilis]|uniref:hypothetical protein n=1 Tax=Proteus mirabilis TaxID=584 RepID=UPI000506743A|nr:hypothetical protein [Proteus mirabilis]MBJ5782526.1 hypothetical protein [Salmonella enterica subsp. enterica serovar Derby]MBJ5791954.1 hypothetical protein [Salmonella enterica subsp. enterica serovar Agona]AUT92177.1 hypothetical protein MC46_010760 [Proteus mirabilis]AUU34873.1 hypothetical protein MC72_005640 [Proteus mirabilis]EKW0544775.1 hypothetical protein [Proteus mirabilis]
MKMIDFNASIISYKSMGNIFVGENISLYISELYEHHDVSQSNYYLPNEDCRIAYYIDNILTIATLLDGTIISIGCNEKYKGKYKNKLYSGMLMGELIKLTRSQRILNGSIIIDEDYGISFILPSPYDEIADYIEHIPLDLRISEIYVSDYSFWASNKK